jgi:hypothetical protein
MIVKELKQSQKEKDEFQSLSSIVKESTEVITEEQPLQQELTAENTVQAPVAVHKRNLQPLFDENPDCIGWVSIPDTQLDYPVMHTPQEPQKYLRKAFRIRFFRQHSVSSIRIVCNYGVNKLFRQLTSGFIFLRNIAARGEKQKCGK